MDRIGQNPLAVTYSWLDILDRTFYIYRENFLSFIVPVALVTIPLVVINFAATYATTDALSGSAFSNIEEDAYISSGELEAQILAGVSSMFGALAIIMLVSSAAGVIQGVFVNGILTYMTSEHHLGRKVSVGQAFNAVKDRFLKLGLALFIHTSIVIGLTVALGMVLFACGLGLGLIVYVGTVLYGFLTPVLVLERIDVGDGLRRAWELGKVRLWAMFGFMAAIGTVSFVFSLAVSAISETLIQPTVGSLSFGVYDVIQVITSSVIGVLVGPVLPVGLTLLYYDTRVRYEGLDIALSALNKPEARPRDLVSPPSMGKWMVRQDWTNLIIMTGVSFALIMLIIVLGQVFS